MGNPNNNGNNQKNNIDKNDFQTNNSNDIFDNFQKQKKNDIKINLLVSASGIKENDSFNNLNNNLNYPVFGDDFTADNIQNHNNNNNLNFNKINNRK